MPASKIATPTSLAASGAIILSSSYPGVSSTNTTSEGLTSGAKAGIGVGVAIGALVAILVVLFYVGQRKKRQRELETTRTTATNQGHELITVANTHEMGGEMGSNFLVVNIKPERGIEEPQAQEGPAAIELGEKSDPPVKMHVPSNDYTTDVRSELEVSHARELDSRTVQKQIAELHSQPSESRSPSTILRHTQLPTANTSQDPEQIDHEQAPPSTASPSPSPSSEAENRLDVLRQRIERVREDKERLERIQQLKDLEAELQREILAEQRKTTGF